MSITASIYCFIQRLSTVFPVEPPKCLSVPLNSKFQLIFPTKYYKKRLNAVSIHFGAYSNSTLHLLKSLT